MNYFPQVPFTEALDLVRSRRVYVNGGLAYVPQEDLVSILLTVYRVHLSHRYFLNFFIYEFSNFFFLEKNINSLEPPVYDRPLSEETIILYIILAFHAFVVFILTPVGQSLELSAGLASTVLLQVCFNLSCFLNMFQPFSFTLLIPLSRKH